MPLFWLSLAFISGILLEEYLHLPILAWVVLGAVTALSLLPPVFRRWQGLLPGSQSDLNRKLRISSLALFPLMILFLALGAIRYQLSQPHIDPSFIAYYNDQPGEILLEGIVTEPPDVRETYTNLRIRVRQVSLADVVEPLPVDGLVLVRIWEQGDLCYGDRVRLRGKLITPGETGDFSYRDHLSRQSIYSSMIYPQVTLLQRGQGNPIISAIFAFRQHAHVVIDRTFPDPEAGLVAGIVLGIQSGIPSEDQEAFRLTGTSHIIVISGFNISIIASVFTKLFRRWLGLFRGALAAGIGIVMYTILVGANPAVIRAAILGILALGAQMVGRKQTGMNSLLLAAALMALCTPTVPWDVSFQLSFAATLGIMLYGEPLVEWFINTASRFIPMEKAIRLSHPVGDYILVTLAAQLTTLPLVIYYFKRLSLSTFIANPLILPAQPPLMILGGLASLFGSIFQPIGQVFAWVTWPLAAYTIRIVEWLAQIPHGSLALGNTALPFIFTFYFALFGLTFIHSHFSPLIKRLKPAYPIGFMAIAAFLAWNTAFNAPDKLLHVTVLDVGTGDAIFIQTPGGRYILINGGSSAARLSDALGRRLSPFHRSLDWLIVGDNDDEDITGISENLERFPPSQVLWAGNSFGTKTVASLFSSITDQSIPITIAQVGHTLDLGSGAFLRTVSVGSQGGVFLLEWGDFRLLLPMGMDFEALDNLQSTTAMRNLSALLLPESGYAPLNPPQLIHHLHPLVALLSLAPTDPDALLSPETLETLDGYTLLRTDINGWITLTTDGEQMWVEVEKR